jgi:ATP-dependent helicase/nuclease subunit A
VHESQLPSFAVRSPTGPKPHEPEEREDESADAASVVRGLAAGVEWGTLVHRLLEFATRHPSATDADLERLANWLTFDDPELRSVVPEALDAVRKVVGSDAWTEARAAGQCEVEVPFAVVTAQPGTPGPPVVLTGVIDLVYRSDEGWRIVDHKTDQLATHDVGATLDRHREQLAAYVGAWKQIAGSDAVKAGLNLIRAGQVAWMK